MKFITTANCVCGYYFNINEVKVYGDTYCFCPNCNKKFFLKHNFYALTKN